MNLTQTEKEAFVTKYQPLLWKTVYAFKSRGGTANKNEEDLFQECMVVLLEHANNAKTQEELHLIPVKDMVNAMCRYILNNQTLSYTKRTTDFSHVIQNCSFGVDYSEIIENTSDSHASDTIFMNDFEKFFKKLPKDQQKIISLKRSNYSNIEVARTMGVCNAFVTRSIRRAQKSYEEYRKAD